MADKPINHGRDHREGGTDPIVFPPSFVPESAFGHLTTIEGVGNEIDFHTVSHISPINVGYDEIAQNSGAAFSLGTAGTYGSPLECPAGVYVINAKLFFTTPGPEFHELLSAAISSGGTFTTPPDYLFAEFEWLAGSSSDDTYMASVLDLAGGVSCRTSFDLFLAIQFGATPPASGTGLNGHYLAVTRVGDPLT